MFDLGKTMQSLETGRMLDEYTGVKIKIGANDNGDDIEYAAGNDSGYVLEVENPWGTQEQADAILASLRLRGVRYQPFKAGSAPIDPAVEIGDGVTVNGTKSVVMQIATTHSPLMAADLSAPYDEEINHEFEYQPKTVREFKRETKYARARLTVNEEAITAEAIRASEAEGVLAGRLTIAADAINAEVTRATAAEGELAGRITINADAITSEVTARQSGDNALGTRIDQRLDGVTISVNSSAGSSTFTIKDGSTTLDTQTLDLSVKAVNISGTLTIGQLESSVQSKINGAVKRSSIIYYSTTSATAPTKPNSWVSATSASQATWTLTRPQYSRDYAYLYTARQVETEDGTYSCSTPTRDYTTTVIDGANIITGSITANQISVTDLSALNATIGGWTIGTTTLNKKSGDYGVYLRAPASPSGTDLAIYVADTSGGSTTYPFSVRYNGKLTASEADISGKITATSGVIGGVTIANGTLSGLSDVNIAVGGISGGSGGSIAGSSLTGWNVASSTLGSGKMDFGVNTNLGYGAAYGAAAQQNSSSPASYFCTNGLTINSNYIGMRHNGVAKALQVITKTIGGTTINYLGYE